MFKKLLLLSILLSLSEWGLNAVTLTVNTENDIQITEFDPANMITNADVYALVADTLDINANEIQLIQCSRITERLPGVIGFVFVSDIQNNDEEIDLNIAHFLYAGDGLVTPLVMINP